MSLTAAEVHQSIQRTHPSVTEAQVAAALAKVDQAALAAKHRARIEPRHWDGKSPINGVSAEVVRAQPNHNVGEVYTLDVDGQTVFLQPFKPGVSGFQPMTAADVLTVAKAHADDLAAQMAAGETVDAVRQALGLA